MGLQAKNLNGLLDSHDVAQLKGDAFLPSGQTTVRPYFHTDRPAHNHAVVIG